MNQTVKSFFVSKSFIWSVIIFFPFCLPIRLTECFICSTNGFNGLSVVLLIIDKKYSETLEGGVGGCFSRG